MQIDKITFNDISIFHQEEEFSIFHKLNFTKTIGGKEWLRRFFTEPHHDLKRILGTQDIIKILLSRIEDWPTEITNGTIIVIDKFLDYNLDTVPENQNAVNSFTYKILHGHDYSMVKYSIRHFADFYRGINKLIELFSAVTLPPNLAFYFERIKKILQEAPLQKLSLTKADHEFSLQENLYFAHHVKGDYKNDTYELIDISAGWKPGIPWPWL